MSVALDSQVAEVLAAVAAANAGSTAPPVADVAAGRPAKKSQPSSTFFGGRRGGE